jgi:hypothetical protein
MPTTDQGQRSAWRRAWRRYALYGLVGWAIEVVATGTSSLLQHRNRSANAHTYLWMHPVYGVGGLVLERIERLTASIA